jgi:hypothetical protein
MLILPSPNNWLRCREEFQLAKNHFRKTERALKIALDVRHDFEVERALSTVPCTRGIHSKLAFEYKLASKEFDKLSDLYEQACQIQRENLKKSDDNIPTIAKSK